MFRLILFLTFTLPYSSHALEVECDSSEKQLFQQFIPSPFGKASRNITFSEVEDVFKVVSKFKGSNSKLEMSRLEVTVCTSSYPLPPLSLTDKNENAHIDLAMQRALNLKKELNKKNISSSVSHKVCGPNFNPQDKNLRFIVKEKSGELYDKAYKELESDTELMKLYQEEALIDNFDVVKKNYPEPFLAKYKPFQGYRVKIFGREICLKKNKVKSSNKESKSAKQE